MSAVKYCPLLQLFSMIKSEDGITRRGDFLWSVGDFSFEKDTIGHIFTEQYYGLHLYCTEIKKKKIVPLLPQSDDDHLFVRKRYYATLKRDSNYKKGISWFEKMHGFSCEVQTKAIAEYLGTFKAENMNKHGN